MDGQAAMIKLLLLLALLAPECSAPAAGEDPSQLSCIELHLLRRSLPAGPAGNLTL